MNGDRRKLHQIYETYTDRIRLLNALHPRLSNHSTRSSDSGYKRSSGSSKGTYKRTSRDHLEQPAPTEDTSVDDFMHNIEKELASGVHISPSHRPNTTGSLGTLSQVPRETLRQRRSVANGLRNSLSATGIPPRTNLPALPYGPQAITDVAPLRVQERNLEAVSQSYAKFYNDPVRTKQSSFNGNENEIDSQSTNGDAVGPLGTNLAVRRPSLNTQDLNRARSNQSPKIELDKRSSRRISIDRHSSRPPSNPIFTTIGHETKATDTVPSPNENALRPPDEPLTRPYWMMRLLSNTFAASGNQETGTFLTKDLFVPKDIWQLQNVKIKGEEEKIQANQVLIEELHQLGCVDREDIGSLFKCLASFEKAMESAQQILSKKLGADLVSSTTIPIRDPVTTPVKKMSSKTFTRFLKGAAVVSDKTDASITTLSSTSGFEGNHVLFQSTTSQLFDLAQLIGQCVTYEGEPTNLE